jgi:hypothetical protein
MPSGDGLIQGRAFTPWREGQLLGQTMHTLMIDKLLP